MDNVEGGHSPTDYPLLIAEVVRNRTIHRFLGVWGGIDISPGYPAEKRINLILGKNFIHGVLGRKA